MKKETSSHVGKSTALKFKTTSQRAIQTVLNCPHYTNKDNSPILREEVEAAVESLRKGKSAGVDNVLAELEQAVGRRHDRCLLHHLQRDLANRRVAPKEGNL